MIVIVVVVVVVVVVDCSRTALTSLPNVN